MASSSLIRRALITAFLAASAAGCAGEVPGDSDATGSPDDSTPGGGSNHGTPGGGSNPGTPGGGSNPGTPGGGPSPGASSEKRLVGYFTAWSIYARNFNLADVPADKLTHINYAFANIAGGKCALGDSWADVEKPMGNDTQDTPIRGNFHQLSLLKQAHPKLKTLISIGGWTWSTAFPALASTPEGRAEFASSCVKFMKDYGFDGLDIDWEFPVSGGPVPGTPADKQNFTLLLEELRKQLDAQGAQDGGAHYLLSIAAPAGPAVIANLEVPRIHSYLDHINVMTYDFHGSWESTTNFNAPLHASPGDPSPGDAKTSFNVDAAVENYLGQGVPADKLVVGMGFYGRSWQGVPAANNGLFQPATGAAPGPYEAGIIEYHALGSYLQTYTRHWSDEAKVPWLYNPQTGIMISYDDAESLRYKAEYVNENALGGAMIWELSGDDAEDTLLETLHGTLAR